MAIMKFNDWKEWVKKNGGIDYDGSYGKQCVDLVQHYAEKVLDIQGAFYGLTYAYEMYTNYGNLPKINNNFKLIDAEKPGEYPQKGDVVVWSKKKNGYAGHAAVCLSGDNTGFTVFEQNYDGKGGIREHKYSYSLVNGWLRPKNQTNLKEVIDLYGNAKMKSAQTVYADSDLEMEVGSVSKNERVYYEGQGENHPIIVYRTDKGYKCGFVGTNSVLVD